MNKRTTPPHNGVGCGGASAPKSLDLPKIWAESLKIWAKSRKIRAKMAPNVALTSKNDAHRLQKNTWSPFLEVRPKKGLHDLCGRKSVGEVAQKLFGQKFGEIRVKILRTPKNLPAPAPVPPQPTERNGQERKTMRPSYIRDQAARQLKA